MDFNKTDKILKRFNLKKTNLRRYLLFEFLKSRDSLSQADLLAQIENKLGAVDRVSIYRNLSQMKAVGLIHEVDVNNYIACTHDCEDHPHILLFCQACQRHREIKEHEQVDKVLSAIKEFEFFGVGSTLSMRGICQFCSAKSQLAKG